MANAKGFTTLSVDGEDYRIRLGFSEIADADEFLGRSIIAAMSTDPYNFHLVRTLFYFATREHTKKINSVKQAGKVLGDADMEEAQKLMWEAMKASGVVQDDSGEA